MDRREFLQQNLRYAALGLVPAGVLQACTRSAPPVPKTAPPPGAKHGAVIAPSHCLAADGKSTIFSFYDLDRDDLREIPVPLETGHIAITHVRNRNLVFVPESAGDRACVIDLGSMKVVQELRATPGRWFGGHGEFAHDGSVLYVSEFEPPPSGKGFLTALSGSDFSKLRSHPSGGRYTHDVSITPDGKHLHIANLGVETGPASRHSGIYVSRFSLPDEKFVGRFELNDDPKIMNGDPISASETHLSLGDVTVKTDAHYFISYMELARPNFQIFVYPHSHKPIVDIWSVPQKRLIREFSFPEQPVALTLMPGRKSLAVVTVSGQVHLIDIAQYVLDRTVSFTKRIKVTTHVNSWAPGPSGYG